MSELKTTNVQTEANVKADDKIVSPGLVVWRRFKRSKIAVAGLCVLIAITIAVILAPVLSTHDPNVYRNVAEDKYMGPSSSHWLGTDDIGRDVYSRLLYGGRVSMFVGIVAVSIQVTIGVILGSIAGYAGGIVDTLIMRLTDIVLSFPFLALAIAVAAIVGPSMWTTAFVIGFLSWTGTCRIVRGQFLQIKSTEYIEATKALGIRRSKVVWRHMLPNAMAPLLINASMAMANAILVEAALSYLGLGVSPPQPSWGNMLQSARNMTVIIRYPHLWLPPGIAIFITVLSINLVGDGLRDALDPRLKL
ncbi:MAG: ABC transporter permease [Firmicutes bacterium]|nr:ABC transporter permease [Bacillota bacterium]